MTAYVPRDVRGCVCTAIGAIICCDYTLLAVQLFSSLRFNCYRIGVLVPAVVPAGIRLVFGTESPSIECFNDSGNTHVDVEAKDED